eukprot:CAMPEP_0119127662 /NCGR_PEP_ID=MMETSP1310-20130426/6125_1 /TAXON_ID=464262 /ORGANISM="Genus nov. species nov., Strain RCC2339" /LENGTH=438 /DNA_ID=CAMNT_0007117941 /DNA_START=87 /DNA_END=1399 /DNA_ORIENTATION=-
MHGIHGEIVLVFNVSEDSFKVTVVECAGLDAKDSNGKSDPYCSLIFQNSKRKTKTVKKTLNPKFHEDFTFPITHAEQAVLLVQVYDWDRIGKDDFIGETHIDIRNIGVTTEPLEMKRSLLSRRRKADIVKMNKSTDRGAPTPVVEDSNPNSVTSASLSEDVSQKSDSHCAVGMSTISQEPISNKPLSFFRSGLVGIPGGFEPALKVDLSDGARRHGTVGAVNPKKPWEHAGSLSMKIQYKKREGSVWILVNKAENLDAHDDNHLSDPYVELSMEKVTKKTAIVKKTLNPTFMEEFYFDVQAGGKLPDIKVMVWDWDKFGGDDVIGGCLIPVSSLTEDHPVDAWFHLNAKFKTEWSSSDTGMLGVHADEREKLQQEFERKKLRLIEAVLKQRLRRAMRSKYTMACEAEYKKRTRRSLTGKKGLQKAIMALLLVVLVVFA